MALKWCTKLEAAYERCPIVFQGHPSNFKVTWDKILLISTRIERFRTVTPVWIPWWIWNDAQSWTWYRINALLFFEVINQIPRSHGLNNWRFESNLRLLGRSQLSNPSDLPCLQGVSVLWSPITWHRSDTSFLLKIPTKPRETDDIAVLRDFVYLESL